MDINSANPRRAVLFRQPPSSRRRPCMLCSVGLRNSAFNMENFYSNQEGLLADAAGSSGSANVLDLSHSNLDDDSLRANVLSILRHYDREENPNAPNPTDIILSLNVDSNELNTLPPEIYSFHKIRIMDLSSCHLRSIEVGISNLHCLRVLIAKNNLLNNESLPKDFGQLTNLEDLNLSGNLFTTVVPQITELSALKSLSIGGNQLQEVPKEIRNLEKLELLYLGGNSLKELPEEMGYLVSLKGLVLCENQLTSLPSSISRLQNLQSLALHKNKLTTLPPDIVNLQALSALSLRDNPLVVRFVREMMYNPPSLLELAARCIKIKSVHVYNDDLPRTLVDYLFTAQHCVNPKCKGVYFNTRVEQIKFVDFCGKYRLPLLQYLCSPRCTTHPAVCSSSDSELSEEEENVHEGRLKQVLLGS